MKNIEDCCADNFLDLETTFLTLNVRPFYLPIDVFHVLKCQSDTRHCTNQPNTCPTHLLSHPKFAPTQNCYEIKDVRMSIDILSYLTSLKIKNISAVFMNLNFYIFVQFIIHLGGKKSTPKRCSIKSIQCSTLHRTWKA